MFRIDHPTAAAALPPPPAALTPGYFQAGVTASGQPATRCEYWWLNMVQGEMEAIVLAAGLAPDKGNNAQVLAALEALFNHGRQITYPMIYDASGVLAPVQGAAFYIFEGVAGGGSGGAAQPTGAGQASGGGGGGAGAFGRIIVSAAQFLAACVNGVLPYSVGAGGAPPSGPNNGNPGGATTLGGNLLVLPGGQAGLSVAPAGLQYCGGGGVSGTPTTTAGANQAPVMMEGAAGDYAIVLNATTVVSGRGASSPWGSGGEVTIGNFPNGNNGHGRGSGGSGGALPQNSGTYAPGGAGAPGRLIFTAFS